MGQTFVIYKDLIIREYRGVMDTEIFQYYIGIIRIRESNRTFTSKKYGMYRDNIENIVPLYDYEIVPKPIPIGKDRQILEINETGYAAGDKDTYYARVHFVISQHDNTIKTHTFNRSPAFRSIWLSNFNNWIRTIIEDTNE